MDFTISEASGLFSIPFLLTMGKAAYDLMNQLGFIFIPFTIALVQCFFEARSQGQDEGAPALVFVKALEARFIPMFAILLCAVMPSTTSDTPNFSFTSYSCLTAPSIIDGSSVSGIDSLKPNTNYADLYGNANPPMLFGLVNQIGAAINGVGIASLNCNQGANHNEAAEIIANLRTFTAVNSKAIKEFDKQCYSNALQVLNRLQSNNEEITVDFSESPYNTIDAFAYDSSPIKKVYNGTITSPVRSTMYFDVPDYWSEIDSSADDTITCESAASTISSTILEDLQSTSGRTRTKSWTSLLSKVKKTINTTNGNTYTDSEAKTEMVHAAYRASGTDWYNPLVKRPSVESTPDVETRVNINGRKRGVTAQQENRARQLENMNSGSAVAGLAYFGALWSNLSKSIETMTYIRITPVIVTITQGMILALAGIILVLSGYNSQVLLQLLVFYFSLSLVPLFLNIGVILETVITGLIENKSNGLDVSNTSVIAIVGFAGKSLIIICPAAWLTFMQLLGLRISQTLDMAGISKAAEEATNFIAKKMAKSMGESIKYGAKRFNELGLGNLNGNSDNSKLLALGNHGMNDGKAAVQMQRANSQSRIN